MSLAKQLGFAFFGVLLIVFAGILFTTVDNTRNYIERQLSSHAQDTATSLGLSITPYLANADDFAIIETMTNAIFDSGYYASIRLVDINQQEILIKTNPKNHEKVPAWFMQLFPIEPPVASSNLNDGWMQHGQLIVVSNPGIAYLQLWQNALSAFWVVFIALIVSQGFVWFIVKRIITQPIAQVIEQTQSISERNFAQIKTVPKTPELSNIVSAVNFMAAKLSSLFKSLDEQSNVYKSFAYTDTLTQIGNRRAFELYIQQILRNPEEHHDACLGLLRASSLADVNSACGPQAGDDYLKALVNLVNDLSKHYFDKVHLYRLTGADIAIVIEHSSKERINEFATKLDESLTQKTKSEYKSGMANIGFSVFTQKDTLKDVLEKADSALSVACASDKSWQFADSLALISSNTQWRETLTKVLDNQACALAQQAIVDANNNAIYLECFARIQLKDNESALPMGQLIPASIRLDYSVKLDKLITKTLLSALTDSDHSLGLNLSRQAIFDETFTAWFLDELSALGEATKKLVIELPERALIQDINQLERLSNRLKQLGAKISVEHFGAQLAGLQHLQNVKPNFVKIDGRYTHNISHEPDNQLFVNTLVNISHGLDIQVIAEMVETENDKAWLLSNNVDYIQGYVISQPVILAS